ncbi:MAG: DUF4347 domain-containing protein, partial [Trichodesmium sp. St2_bin2_1]|nr:DUF4347 domain-containing protein [Trichodesmium sp. St2_bin2_1]
LYGCNVAAGDGGEEFIDKLHRLTGAEIAASKSLTGAAVKGGNWELEVRTGQQPPTSALQTEVMQTYSGVLEPKPGLTQTYYNSNTLDHLINPGTPITVEKIDYPWNYGRPTPSVGDNNFFNVVWEGWFRPTAETHRFDMVVDDDVRIQIDLNQDGDFNDDNETSQWHNHRQNPHQISYNVRNDKAYKTKITYFEHNGPAYVHIKIDGNINLDEFFVTNTPILPSDIVLINKDTIHENVAANSKVGTLSTLYPDNRDYGSEFTYSLVSGTGDTDNSAFTISGDQLTINSSPDYETKSSYSIRVQTTDGEGSSHTEQLTINVNDVNEAPTDIDLDNKTIDENVAPNSVVGTFSTTDPDSGDSFTYTLVTG